jgi:hypothetical protein
MLRNRRFTPMSILKSNAVVAGLMPDFNQVGVVLCRTGSYKFTAEKAKTFCTGTIQMVPVPNGAMILGWELKTATLGAGVTGNDVGFGDDADYLADGLDFVTADVLCGVIDGVVGNLPVTMTKDDTIDITFNKLDTKIPTNTELILNVYYKMTGTLDDES